MTIEYKSLPIECLHRSRYQPRIHFDQKSLQELADSIRSQGLIEPLIVREISAHQFEIIAGERRWRAAMLAQLRELPCLIGSYSDEQAAALSVVENIQREALNIIEEANAYQRLVVEFHFQQDDIAALVGKSRSHIANLLRLLTLCPLVQEKIVQGYLTLGHARMLVGLPVHEQIQFAQAIEKHHWSVRQLENKIRALKAKSAESIDSHDVQRLELGLSEQVGAPVKIVEDPQQGGWLHIKFFDNDTLAGLLERLGLRYD